MNIFALDEDPIKAAQYHCDKHIVKMATEYCQILSTSLHVKLTEQIDKMVDMREHVKECSNCFDQFVTTMGVNFGEQIDNYLDVVNKIPYKKTHQNHPSVKWAYDSLGNFTWLLTLAEETHQEYTKRYKKIHKAYRVIEFIIEYKEIVSSIMISDYDIQSPGLYSDIPLVMPEEYHSDSFVQSYREYYMGEKSSFAKWDNGTDKPNWYRL